MPRPVPAAVAQSPSSVFFRAWSCPRTSLRTPRANVPCSTRGSFFHSKSLTWVNRVPATVGSRVYSTRKTEALSSWRSVSPSGARRSTSVTESGTAGRSGTGLWMTIHRPSPLASTDLTFRHQRGSFCRSFTIAQTVSTGRSISIDFSTRISCAERIRVIRQRAGCGCRRTRPATPTAPRLRGPGSCQRSPRSGRSCRWTP